MSRAVVIACAVVLSATLTAGCGTGEGSSRSSAVTANTTAAAADVRFSQCGGRWGPARDGRLDLAITNHYSEVAEVYLANARTGAVYDELEGLAPGASARIDATLGDGAYRLQCYTEENNPWLGPVEHVTSSASGPAITPGVAPVTFAQLVPPTKAYEAWIRSRLPVLLLQVEGLRAAVRGGPTVAAKAAWLRAHLTYETLGAAYDAFGPLDEKINGSPPGSESWRADHDLSGFHLIEGLLWSGAPTAKLVAAVTRLQRDVEHLITQFATAEIQPADLPLRAHEIVENAVQFELNAQTDAGSGTNLATLDANLSGAAQALSFVVPILRSRYPRLTQTRRALAATRKLIASFDRHGRWTPIRSLRLAQRERVDASVEDLAELLAPVAAIGDIRNTPASGGQ